MTVEIIVRGKQGAKFPAGFEVDALRVPETKSADRHLSGFACDYFDEDTWLWRRDVQSG
ncbi:MAG: hypothetical protein GF418_08185 [Chitinivibrionales bacterium]|nr:hypothetical protein [Chitinivibrionales bacterium]MBD3395592.1 hypothetical protein [Chitinivibrionales bacterium]